MTGKHETIIAAAAKANLDQLGFKRRGRSRLWIADHLWWLNIVEFTPNRWSKGVNLMNAVHWLWCGAGFMAFNEAIPSQQHAEFETEDQFRTAAVKIAEEAAMKARELELKFSTFDRVADFVVGRARDSDRMRPSWWGLEAGIASGVCGRAKDAEHFLHEVTDERVAAKAAPFLNLISENQTFRDEANAVVAQQRAILKLPPLEHAPF